MNNNDVNPVDPEDQTAVIAAEAANIGAPDKSAYDTDAINREKLSPGKKRPVEAKKP